MLTAQKIFIVSGPVGGGKTTFTKKLIVFLRENNIKAGGIISERVMSDYLTTGYDLVNIETGEKEAFIRKDEKCGSETIGRFTICPKGLAMGNSILNSLSSAEFRIVIIDEVGALELGNKGWAGCIQQLLEKSENNILITVRDSFVDKVKYKWGLMDAITFNIKETDYLDAGGIIADHINSEPGI